MFPLYHWLLLFSIEVNPKVHELCNSIYFSFSKSTSDSKLILSYSFSFNVSYLSVLHPPLYVPN